MAELTLNLGIDFGTSFTKVCVRDTDLNKSWVVTFSQRNSQLDEALLTTKIGIGNNGRLLAGLTQSEWKDKTTSIQASVDFIKMRLANIDLNAEGQGYPFDSLQSFQGVDLNTPESLENLCAYYLSNVILKAKAWILQNNAELVKNQTISWSINVGVPVKYFDSQAIERFKKVICLAWLLSESQPQTFEELRQRMTQLRRELPREDIPCFAIPEIAAAVYSYTVSRQAEPGIYIFFDIGSGTIEGASFQFWRENQMPKVEFYSGEVEPIGIDALAKRIANSLPNTENEITHALIKDSHSLLNKIYTFSETIARSAKQGEHIANKIFLFEPYWRVLLEEVQLRLKEDEDFQSQKLLHLILGQHLIHKEVSTVILSCRNKIPDKFKGLPSLRIFLGGGGRESEFYRDTIESTHSAFGHHNSSIPLYDVQNVPFPSDFNMSGISKDYFHRFAIAYGLSIPEYETPEVTGFPKQFPDAPPPSPAKPYTPEWGRYPDDNSSM